MVQVIWIVSPTCSVIALKVAAARSTLWAELLPVWLTKQLCATVVAAVASVKVFTTVEDPGFAAPVMSVTAPAAAAKPLVVSSDPFCPPVPPASPQSPLEVAPFTPVEDWAADGAAVLPLMAMKLKLQEADTAQKPSLLLVTSFSTYTAPVLNITLCVEKH